MILDTWPRVSVMFIRYSIPPIIGITSIKNRDRYRHRMSWRRHRTTRAFLFSISCSEWVGFEGFIVFITLSFCFLLLFSVSVVRDALRRGDRPSCRVLLPGGMFRSGEPSPRLQLLKLGLNTMQTRTSFIGSRAVNAMAICDRVRLVLWGTTVTTESPL